MTKPRSTIDNKNNDLSDSSVPENSDALSLAETLEQTVFESFDEGLYIGMMSGTSLDGMDAVLCQFSNDSSAEEDSQAPMRLLATHSQDFPPRLREVLLALCQPNGVKELIASDAEPNSESHSELEWFGWASREYGEFASEVVNTLLTQADIDAESVLAIGCHGQTVRHRPQMGFSLQLVDANIIAERTGISVVSDFRRRDMAVGGQGAPLVPAFHQALFATPDSTRVLLNLGGIANITVLPVNDKPVNEAVINNNAVIGYDTGPANLLLDAWAALHTGKDYDAGGAWAQSGQIIEPLLNQLLAHPFFAKPYPKSTGREDFNLAWLQAELQTFEQTTVDTRYAAADVQATLTELTAISASSQITQFIKNDKHSAVYVCGGGALNDYLMSRLRTHLPQCSVETTASLGLEPTWVEAVAFAWLARQTLIGETGNLPAVTGASKNVVLGQVCFA
ncbi:anhydro-N-acetylmuramic acid kinase [Psychrobacter okhotskensis]|uniref:anhydro-N-acetylmuramic acid kinase n=1 Tax=Psychrobacter okhotskensis TaxID=212403 RepID=UPI001565A910|nr:anhydro-N-acetylmuramic acid kinase [Psychrobacter okhotskensis]NRD70773.1 anhydro-N-acetylmuramic acid kinase [Psychrobacter okhotskensis]